MKFFLIFLCIITALTQGCYYDKQELLNPGNAICDTTTITFSGSVNPILMTHCVVCHSGANPPLGVKLDTYTGVKAQASNGKLFGSINYSPGFSPMPKNSAKLSNCNIAKIRKWISAGALNN